MNHYFLPKYVRTFIFLSETLARNTKSLNKISIPKGVKETLNIIRAKRTLSLRCKITYVTTISTNNTMIVVIIL